MADRRAVVAVVTRLSARLVGFGGPVPRGPEAWGDTRLVLGDGGLAGTYRDAFTGRRLATDGGGGEPGLAMAEVLGRLPVALLVREGDPA